MRRVRQLTKYDPKKEAQQRRNNIIHGYTELAVMMANFDDMIKEGVVIAVPKEESTDELYDE